jgi:hypothetical protein
MGPGSTEPTATCRELSATYQVVAQALVSLRVNWVRERTSSLR